MILKSWIKFLVLCWIISIEPSLPLNLELFLWPTWNTRPDNTNWLSVRSISLPMSFSSFSLHTFLNSIANPNSSCARTKLLFKLEGWWANFRKPSFHFYWFLQVLYDLNLWTELNLPYPKYSFETTRSIRNWDDHVEYLHQQIMYRATGVDFWYFSTTLTDNPET